MTSALQEFFCEISAPVTGSRYCDPRGPMTIDPATREPVQTIYIRKVEMKDGHYWSMEFDKIDNVKDPGT